jgi:hypothetical protein
MRNFDFISVLFYPLSCIDERFKHSLTKKKGKRQPAVALLALFEYLPMQHRPAADATR